MKINWIYELQSLQLGLLTVGFVVFVLLGAFLLSRSLIRRRFLLSESANDTVNGFFSGMGVFYGVLLGQVAVAAWQNSDTAEALIAREATEITVLYRNVSVMPEPYKTQLQNGVREYLHYIVEVVWPAHRHGDYAVDATVMITRMHKTLSSFVPGNEGEKVIFQSAYLAFNEFLDARHARVDADTGGLPTEMWVVVFLGGILIVVVTFFFYVNDKKVHFLLTGMLSIFVGLMIYLIAAMDDPFRSQDGVTAESYQRVLRVLDRLDPARLP